MSKIKKRYIIGGISLLLFIIITVLVTNNKINFLDDGIYSVVYKLRQSNLADVFFKTITRLGDTIPTIIIVLILLFTLKKEDKLLLLIAEITTIILNQGIKYIIRRERPPLFERLIEQGGYSYPSGHSMMALCLYGVLIYIVCKNIKDKKKKIIMITLLTILILLIGISRIYVRVHYPSDVIGGYLLTIPILIMLITLLNNHFRGNKND